MKKTPQHVREFLDALQARMIKIAQEQNILFIDADPETGIALRQSDVPFLHMSEFISLEEPLPHFIFHAYLATDHSSTGVMLMGQDEDLEQPRLNLDNVLFTWAEREQALNAFEKALKADMAQNISYAWSAPSL